ncbi:MAG: hypothetical protein AVDCRST_MAG85-2123, partial [uncultured Solirubrobacteraceae bacterium]
ARSRRPGSRRGAQHRRGDQAAARRDGPPAARRGRDARGPAHQAQPRVALHGRRVGVPRRRCRHGRGRGRRGQSCSGAARARGGGRGHAGLPRRPRPVEPVDHAGRGEDPLRHLVLPSPDARRPRRAADRRARGGRHGLVHAAGRARRVRPRGDRARVPDDQDARAARPVRLRTGRARLRPRPDRRADHAEGRHRRRHGARAPPGRARLRV